MSLVIVERAFLKRKNKLDKFDRVCIVWVGV